jgi:predicted outer membrane repeat protein
MCIITIILTTLARQPINNVSAAISIQALIDAASDGGVVDIPADTYNESLVIGKNITLRGSSNTNTILQPAGVGQRVITVASGYNLRLENLQVSGAQISDSGGGGYLAGGSLEVDNCKIINNAAAYGGGIFQEGNDGGVTIENSVIAGNSAVNHGGGIYARGDFTLISSDLTNNTAGWHGGGAHIDSGDAQINAAQITGNIATNGNGGGININNSITITESNIFENTAGEKGGGVNQWNDTDGVLVNITDITFDSNTAVIHGAGLNVEKGAETIITTSDFIDNSVHSHNTTNTSGGGLYFFAETPGNSLTITGSTFTGNDAQCTGCGNMSGGGVYAVANSAGLISLSNNYFEDNFAWSGGGLFADLAEIENTIFKSNSSGYGGGVYISDTSTIRNSIFLQNHAVNEGGALIAGGVNTNISIFATLFDGTTIGTPSGAAVDIKSFGATLENVAILNTIGYKSAAIDIENMVDRTINLNHVTINGVSDTASVAERNPSGIRIANSTDVNIYNSIISNIPDGTGVSADTISAAELDKTLWYNNAINTGAIGTITSTNPHSGNPAFASDGYHLTAASPAIGLASATSVPSDIDGEIRDAHPDLGADEYNLPAVSVSDISVTEGNTGTSNATFTITLDYRISSDTQVDYQTNIGSAGSTDFDDQSGTLTIPAETLSKTVSIPIYSDLIDEIDEEFYLQLSNPINAYLEDASGTCTIMDDDAPPVISVVPGEVIEGYIGTTDLIYTITLSAQSEKNIQFTLTTQDGTATADLDYLPFTGLLSFSPLESQAMIKTMTIKVIGDFMHETNETIQVTISDPENATLGIATATLTIVDNNANNVFLPLLMRK